MWCLRLLILNRLDPFNLSELLKILSLHLKSTVALTGNSRHFTGQPLVLLIIKLLLNGVLVDNLVLFRFALVWMLPHHLPHELVTHYLHVTLLRLSTIFRDLPWPLLLQVLCV